MSRMQLTIVALLLAGMSPSPQNAWGQRRTDTVQLIEGSPLRGEVIRATPDAIELSQAGTTRTVAVSDISQVLFGDEPAALRSARDAAVKQNWEQALQGLDRIDADDVRVPWIAEDVQFYRAYCDGQLALNQGTGVTEAAASLLNFVKRYRESRYTYAAAEILGQLALRLGRPDRAAQFFSQLSNASDPATQLRGMLRQAEMLRSQGKDGAAEALELYEKATQTRPVSSAVRRSQLLATIGKCRCLALLGRAAEGVPILESLVAENSADDTELFAQAYLALGDCHRQLGQTQDAVLDLLHVDLLFQDQSEAHAEALFRLSQLWPQLGKPDRAVDARNRLNRLFAGSPWAQMEP